MTAQGFLLDWARLLLGLVWVWGGLQRLRRPALAPARIDLAGRASRWAPTNRELGLFWITLGLLWLALAMRP